MTTTLPGENVPAQHANLKLGPGLLQLSRPSGSSSIITTRAGELNHSANGAKWWVETNSKRYVPALHEAVIGVVTGRAGEGWRIDIGSAHSASLDALAFEGATKRNKPQLKINTLVYARVSLAHKDMDPELECFDAQTHKAAGFGELKGGFLVKCSLGLCRTLLDPSHYLLPLLGSKFPVEFSIGVNGRIWILTKAVQHTIAAARCIEAVDPARREGAIDEVGVKKLLASMEL